MKALSKLTLAQRLYTFSTVLIAGMVALAVAVWWLMQSVANDADSVGKVRVPQLQRIADIELNVTRTSLQLRHAILARTPEEMNAALADVAEKRRLMDAALDQFGRAMDDPAGRQAYAPLPDLYKKFWAVGAENIALIQAGQKDAAFAFLVDKTVPARNALLAPLGTEKKRQADLLASAVTDIESGALSVRTEVLLAVLLVGLGIAGFS